MIQEIYLKKAINIRKEYLLIRRDIDSYMKISQNLSESITKNMGQLEGLLDKINKNRISNIDAAKNELHKIIIDIESDMNDVDKSINDLEKKIEKLKEDEVVLYKEIKQNYPNMKDEDIKNYLFENFKKLNIA